MAVQYVTMDNLGKAMERYGNTVKLYTNEQIKAYIKAVTFDDETNKLKFYTVPAPVPAGTEPYLEVEVGSGDFKIDTENANGLEVGADGLKLNLAVAPDAEHGVVGSAGAISAEEKAVLSSFSVATEQQIRDLFE